MNCARENVKDCIVIGAGAAGLAAAHALATSGLKIKVLECEAEVGGRARTDVKHGVVFERGAGFIANFYSSTLALAAEAGVTFHAPAIVPGRSGRIHKLLTPKGLVSHNIATPLGFLCSPLLSSRDKVRAVGAMLRLHFRGAPHIANLEALARDDDGIDAAQWGGCTFGSDAVDYVVRTAVEPFFYFGIEEISATVARSILHHAIGWRPLVASGGMGELFRAFARPLEIRLGVRVCAIETAGSRIVISHSSGQDEARAVIVAIPAPAIREIDIALTADDRIDLESIEYVPSVRANLGYDRRSVLSAPLITIAGPGRHRISGISEMSAWNPDRVPAGKEVVRISATASLSRELLDRDDQEVIVELINECNKLGIRVPNPEWTDVVSIRDALVLPSPGHFRKTFRFVQRPRQQIHFAGDWLTGSTIEGAVRSGLTAARAVLAELR